MTAKTPQEAHARLLATLPATTHVRHVELPYDPLTGRIVANPDSPTRRKRPIRDSRAVKAGGRVNTWIEKNV